MSSMSRAGGFGSPTQPQTGTTGNEPRQSEGSGVRGTVKDTLSNIMAGFLIFWDKPFHVGDWISIGDKEGKVAEITMRTTRVMTRRNTWVIIPNETVINQVLGISATSTQVTAQMGRGFLQQLGILKPDDTGITNAGPGGHASRIPRVYGRQATEYVIRARPEM